jgi:glycine hydroxymethyltransferase
MLVDLRPKGVTGKAAEASLERAGITCNKNAIPFDPGKADDHLRHPPRHAGRHHARLRPGRVPRDRLMIGEVLDGLAAPTTTTTPPVEQACARRVWRLCARFPIYPTGREAEGSRPRCAARSAA